MPFDVRLLALAVPFLSLLRPRSGSRARLIPSAKDLMKDAVYLDDGSTVMVVGPRRAEVYLPKELAQEMQAALDGTVRVEDAPRDGAIAEWGVVFGDGVRAYVAVVNGDGPWVDATLFDPDGNEVTALEPGERLLGDYEFEGGGRGVSRHVRCVPMSFDPRLLALAVPFLSLLKPRDGSRARLLPERPHPPYRMKDGCYATFSSPTDAVVWVPVSMRDAVDEIVSKGAMRDRRVGSVIRVWTFDYPNKLQVIVGLLNGDDDLWFNAELFDDHGDEVFTAEPGETLIQGYHFEHDGESYSVQFRVIR